MATPHSPTERMPKKRQTFLDRHTPGREQRLRSQSPLPKSLVILHFSDTEEDTTLETESTTQTSRINENSLETRYAPPPSPRQQYFQSKSKAKLQPNPVIPDNNNNNIFNCIVIGLVIGAVALIANAFARSNSVLWPTCDLLDYGALTDRFPDQNAAFLRSLQLSINDTLRGPPPTKPSVFLFAYQNHKNMLRFMDAIIRDTINCSTGFEVRSPVVLTAYNFTSVDEYGVIVDACKKLLQQGLVLHVTDIEKIPATKAQALHSICDTINPLVSPSIIYLTLYINPDPKANTQIGLEQIVSDTMQTIWQDLGHNILDPLISRITDQIFLLR